MVCALRSSGSDWPGGHIQVVGSFSVPSRPPSQKSQLEKVTAYTQVSLVVTAPPTAMDGSSMPQATTPDGHSHPSQPYDPNVGSAGTSGVPHQVSPDPDHSMDWQDVSFASTEADEIIPEDEDEAAYKRRKARERQRRKRMRDRAAGIGRNGQPAAPRRSPPDPAALAAMSPEEIRKEKTRRAARERQRKHRAVVRARRAEEETGTEPQSSASGGASGGAPGSAPTVPESTLPVNPPEPTAEPHIEQDVNSSESHPVPYEQPQPFTIHRQQYGQATRSLTDSSFIRTLTIPGPSSKMQPPQTMNPMQMQVSPAPPSPRPTGTPAPAPTPSPAPAPPPEPSPTSASAPQPSGGPPPVGNVVPGFPPPTSAPAPAPATTPTPIPPATPVALPASPTPTAQTTAVPPAPSLGLPMSAMMPMGGPTLTQPPPSHTSGQAFAMIVSLALNTSEAQLLRAHIMHQLRLTVMDMTELEGVIARAFDAWDRERGGDSSNSQLQQAMQIPGSLPSMFRHMPPTQPQQAVAQSAPAPSQTLVSQPQAPAQPPAQSAPQPQQPPEPTMSQQSPTQARVHPPPTTPQNQPRAPRTSTVTSRRTLGVGQPQMQTATHTQSQPAGTLNVPRPIAGRSVSVSGPSARSIGLNSAQAIVAASNEQAQRTVSQPQRHSHIPPPAHGMRAASSSVTMTIAGQKRPAPNQPGSSQTRPAPAHPIHSAPAPPGQTRSTTQPSPQIQTRPQPQQQQHSRPGSQPQTPILGPSTGGSASKSGSGRWQSYYAGARPWPFYFGLTINTDAFSSFRLLMGGDALI
ncbi:hypothetical protein RHS01_09564 [Rhizoctonia solani]|uniref:Uncharacterized protein n=1 Tax=Rhizoctonia solani TaxID=456999 RepID=A0A8H7M1G0_9AGAM|nr:hypothetical protein RHS01_09564 [Rhizoctonia solani]